MLLESKVSNWPKLANDRRLDTYYIYFIRKLHNVFFIYAVALIFYFCLAEQGNNIILTFHTQIHHLCRNSVYLYYRFLVYGTEWQNKDDLKLKTKTPK